jgi:hypothetical protein
MPRTPFSNGMQNFVFKLQNFVFKVLKRVRFFHVATLKISNDTCFISKENSYK